MSYFISLLRCISILALWFSPCYATLESSITPLFTKDICSLDGLSILLKIKNICAKNINTKLLESSRIKNAEDIFTDSIVTKNIAAKFIATDRLGVNNDVYFNSNLGVAHNLSVGGFLHATEVCQVYRAVADLSSDIMYGLGNVLPFNHKVDDPNNNVSLPPFSYTVPASGYYYVNVEVDQKNLVVSQFTFGNPTAHIDLLVNNDVFYTSNFAYITSIDEQRNVITALFCFNAGDVVQARYRISTTNPSTGVVSLAGTVTLEGGAQNSHFTIHYLSSTGAPGTTPCTPSSFDTLL
jgi:hypothetical protein